MKLIIIEDGKPKPESGVSEHHLYTSELYKLLMTGGLSHHVTTFEQRLDMCVSIAQNQLKKFISNYNPPINKQSAA